MVTHISWQKRPGILDFERGTVRGAGGALTLVMIACSSSEDPAAPGNATVATTTSASSTSSSTTTSGTTGAATVAGPSTATSSSTSSGVTATSTTGMGTATADTNATTGTNTTGDATTSTTSTTGGGAGGATATSTDGTSTTGGSTEPCPTDATFCSSFEENALPAGAVYKLNGDPATPWTTDFEVDTTVAHAGQSSLRVRPNGEGSGAYKMLAVPAPGAVFWVRFYLRSNVELGNSDHNVYAYAAGSDDPNDSTFVEFAEDVGLAFNSHDLVRWPDGFGRLDGGGTMPYTLPADTWHCIEISFDGQTRVQQLFVDGTLTIDAADYPAEAQAFTTFKFGYNALHGTTRSTWYDDVAVASARIGCL